MNMHKTRWMIGGFLVVALGVLQGTAQEAAQPRANQAQQGGAHNELMNQLQELRKQGEAIQAQLGEISQKAEEKNPELLAQHEALMELYQEKLAEHGYPNEAEMQKLQEMQNKLQAGQDMDNAERQQLTREFQGKVAQLQQAQEKARQDKEVQAAMNALEETRAKAMHAIDDRTEDLMKQQAEINQKIENLQQKLQQQFQMRQ